MKFKEIFLWGVVLLTLLSVIMMGATVITIVNTMGIIVENQSSQTEIIHDIQEIQKEFSEILVTLAKQDNILMDILSRFRDSFILPGNNEIINISPQG